MTVFTVTTFTLAVCTALCCSVVGSTLSRAVLTTMERYYGLSTSMLASFTSANQLAAVIATPIMITCVKNKSTPKVLWLSFITKAFAFFLVVIPHVFGPKYNPDGFGGELPAHDLDSNETFCLISDENRNVTDELNDGNSHFNMWSLWLLVGKSLLGIAGCVVWPLTMAFIDDNSKPGQSGMLIALNMCVTLIGPMIGYTIAGMFLKLWVNWPEPAPINIDPRGSEWVGAWWMGYYVVSIAIIIFSLPLFFFPKTLKTKKLPKNDEETKEINLNLNDEKILPEKNEELEKIDSNLNDEKSNVGVMKQMWIDTKSLFTNPLYLMMITNSIVAAWAMAAKGTFGQKYMEIQFNLTPAEASKMKIYYIGALVVGAGLGGFIMKKTKMKPLGVIRYLTINGMVGSAIFFSLWFLPGCTPQTKDLLFGYHNNQTLASCECTTDIYVPMCGSQFEFEGQVYENTTILSPCLAGCKNVHIEDDGEMVYEGCQENITRGICGADDCSWRLYLYIAVVSLGTFTGGLNFSPSTVFMMRAVLPGEKAYSIALIGVCMKLLGWVPAPIVFGRLFELYCVVSGSRGNCIFYDNTEVRNFYFGILAAFQTLSYAFTVFYYWMFVRRLRSDKPMWGGMNTDEPM